MTARSYQGASVAVRLAARAVVVVVVVVVVAVYVAVVFVVFPTHHILFFWRLPGIPLRSELE